jgi:hypothetical protein
MAKATPGTLWRIEIWSTMAYDSGVALAVVTGLTVATIEEHYEFDGWIPVRTLRVTAERDNTWTQHLAARRVLRVQYSDGDFDEFRLVEYTQGRWGDNQVTLVANGPLVDLADRSALLTVTSTNPVVSLSVSKTDTVSNLIAWALTAMPGGWTVGTVTPSDTLTIRVEQATAMDALVAIAQEYYKRFGNGSLYRIDWRRNGTTSYFVDLQSMASVPVKQILARHNLLEATVSTYDDEQRGDRVYPFSSHDGGGIGPAYYEVSAVSVNTYVDLIGIGSHAAPPAAVADEFNGLSLVPMQSSAAVETITDTVLQDAVTTRCSIGTTAAFSVGHWVRLAANSQKAHHIYVGSGAPAKTIKVTADVPTHTNWLDNPAFANGTTDWTVGNYWSLVTTAGLYGGAAMVCDEVGSGKDLSQSRTVYLPFKGTWTYSIWFRSTDGTGTFLFKTYNLTTGALSSGATIPVTDTGGEWRRFDVTSTCDSTTATRTVGVTITRDIASTANSFYIGAVQLTYGEALLDFVDGSGAARLRTWAIRKAYTTGGGSYTSVKVDLIDLYRYNGLASEQFELWLGEWMWIGVDASLDVIGGTGTGAIRIIEAVTWDLLNPLKATVILDAQRRGITNFLG